MKLKLEPRPTAEGIFGAFHTKTRDGINVNPRLPALAKALLRLPGASAGEVERTIAAELRKHATHRLFTDYEIKRAVNTALRWIEEEEGGRNREWCYTRHTRKYPRPRCSLIQEALEDHESLQEIIDHGVVGLPEGKRRGIEAVRILFPRKRLLCVGRSKRDSESVYPQELTKAEVDHFQFIVPYELRGLSGLTQEGEESCRALANINVSWGYQVTEFDFTPEQVDRRAPPEWAHLDLGDRDPFQTKAKMLCLACIGALYKAGGPLVMIVDSGKKSLHAWWSIEGAAPEGIHQFRRRACVLGMDRVHFTPNQFTRFPCGIREESGRIQEVLYFNPDLALGHAR